MTQSADKLTLSLFSTCILIVMVASFKYIPIFWFSYTNLLGIGIVFAFFFGYKMNTIPFFRALLIGLPIGIIGYIAIRFVYTVLPVLSPTAFENVKQLLDLYAPSHIWQYIVLYFIIVLGEEMIWRVYIQQELKKIFSIPIAILFTAIHFGLPLFICGYYIGALAAFLSGIIFGILYEWLKSLTVIIVAHLVMALLLFLLFPLDIFN